MDLNLQPRAPACYVSKQPFAAGDRVTSILVWTGENQALRYDVLADRAEGFVPEGVPACRWTYAFKPKAAEENADRALKLNAENLFLTLADPANEPSPENTRLIQFLGLMLERKRVLRARGKSADGSRQIYEHARSKLPYEVPVGDFGPAFFASVQGQLSVLVGEPKPAPEPAPAAPAATP